MQYTSLSKPVAKVDNEQSCGLPCGKSFGHVGWYMRLAVFTCLSFVKHAEKRPVTLQLLQTVVVYGSTAMHGRHSNAEALTQCSRVLSKHFARSRQKCNSMHEQNLAQPMITRGNPWLCPALELL